MMSYHFMCFLGYSISIVLTYSLITEPITQNCLNYTNTHNNSFVWATLCKDLTFERSQTVCRWLQYNTSCGSLGVHFLNTDQLALRGGFSPALLKLVIRFCASGKCWGGARWGTSLCSPSVSGSLIKGLSYMELLWSGLNRKCHAIHTFLIYSLPICLIVFLAVCICEYNDVFYCN